MNENQTTIGGRIISVGYLSPTEALKVQVAVVNLCGEALFKAVSAKGSDAQEAGAAAIVALSSKLDPTILLETIQRIYTTVRIDGKALPFEEAFAGGRLKEMWQVTFFALRYNFKDFLPESLFTQIAAKVNPVSSQLSSQTSIGTSGDQ